MTVPVAVKMHGYSIPQYTVVRRNMFYIQRQSRHQEYIVASCERDIERDNTKNDAG